MGTVTFREHSMNGLCSVGRALGTLCIRALAHLTVESHRERRNAQVLSIMSHITIRWAVSPRHMAPQWNETKGVQQILFLLSSTWPPTFLKTLGPPGTESYSRDSVGRWMERLRLWIQTVQCSDQQPHPGSQRLECKSGCLTLGKLFNSSVPVSSSGESPLTPLCFGLCLCKIRKIVPTS